MWPECVVFQPPFFNQHLGLLQGIANLTGVVSIKEIIFYIKSVFYKIWQVSQAFIKLPGKKIFGNRYTGEDEDRNDSQPELGLDDWSWI